MEVMADAGNDFNRQPPAPRMHDLRALAPVAVGATEPDLPDQLFRMRIQKSMGQL